MSINILDSVIINRISAGEVVESPFSIVKELIDNSLDAGATKISVEIKNGGIDYISVLDNGKGIEQDDLVKAFLPHATSKIKTVADLDAIYTLGFRGEALASISNVSHCKVISKISASDCAYTLNVDGGEFSEISPTASENGTQIIVEDLFYNTPVRRKFLKKPKQEENQITNIIARYILAHPNIQFKYIANGNLIYQTRGNSLLDAIFCVYGVETTQNILPINKSENGITISGYVSKIGYSKPNTSYQTLIVNNRFVEDETVSKAVYMAYEEYLMTRQFPFFVLNISMPNIDVDVNVHPNKMNIKFANPNLIYNLVYSAVRAAILNIPTPNIEKEQPIKNSLIDVDVNSLKEIEIDVNKDSLPTLNTTFTLKQNSFTPLTIFDLHKGDQQPQESENNTNKVETLNEVKTNEENDYVSVKNLSDYKIIGELFNEFIVLEKGDNMILLDFHAGHERLNYDKLSKLVEDRQVSQRDLLVPYVQELSVKEVEYILSLASELSLLGFEINSFGDNKIIISSIPVQLKDINLKTFVDDLIHDMKNPHPKLNYDLVHFLMQKACKSSVKSGQKLNEMEIKELLKNLDEKKPVLLCPHGRPIYTTISRTQIEKWFKRIV